MSLFTSGCRHAIGSMVKKDLVVSLRCSEHHQLPFRSSPLRVKYQYTRGLAFPFINLPSVKRCPQASCPCLSMPEIEIDRTTRLAGTAPGYSCHVMIHTGCHDWRSRIEEEGVPGSTLPQTADSNAHTLSFGPNPAYASERERPNVTKVLTVAAGLKKGLGRSGQWFDPTQTALVTNSSFESPNDVEGTTVTIFPSFHRITGISDTEDGHNNLIRILRSKNMKPGAVGAMLVSDVTTPIVLICSHASRDRRCGIIGPILHAEFLLQLERLGMAELKPSVGMCSHIGGHKWAGNIIVYIPPGWSQPGMQNRSSHNLKGRGIWYGRVEPRHVEGIIKETIVAGKIIEELCRGVV